MDPELLEQTRINGKQDLSLVLNAYDLPTVTPDECKKLCSKIGLKYYDGYERRIIQYTFTDGTVDRYQDVIIAKGVDLTRYKSNPIVLAFHNSSWYPVASTIRAWYDKESDSVKGWVLFYDENIDDSGFANTTFKFASNGAVKTGSIGFVPKQGKTRRPTDQEKKDLGMGDYGYIYDEIELLEFSIVPLPANPSAMMEPITKGFFSKRAFASLQEVKAFNEEEMKSLKEAFESYEKTLTPEQKPMDLTLSINALDFTPEELEGFKKQWEKDNAKVILTYVKSAPAINITNLAQELNLKAGAVLSKKNIGIVKDALAATENLEDALTNLLVAAGETVPADDETDEGKSGKGKEKSTNSPAGGESESKSDLYSKDFLDKLDKASELFTVTN